MKKLDPKTFIPVPGGTAGIGWVQSLRGKRRRSLFRQRLQKRNSRYESVKTFNPHTSTLNPKPQNLASQLGVPGAEIPEESLGSKHLSECPFGLSLMSLTSQVRKIFEHGDGTRINLSLEAVANQTETWWKDRNKLDEAMVCPKP